MRILIAGIATETNTFSPLPTGLASFSRGDLYRGDASQSTGFSSPLVKLWRLRAEALGWSVIESLIAVAPPGGRTLLTVYEGFREEILNDARAYAPYDVVLLSLHGAMVAHGYDDCEGDLIGAVREVVGTKCIIGAELDPHCHLTEPMTRASDFLVMYKEYPHTDILERAEELFSLCERAAMGALRPTYGVFDCQMIGLYPTTTAPMIGFVSRLKEVERLPGVLSVSFCHGFPWADVSDVGSKVLVITDGSPQYATDLARELGLEVYRLRRQLLPQALSIDLGLKVANDSAEPVVIADTSDNAGGGAPSDNTALLRAVIGSGGGRMVLGCYWDPGAVALCAEAGVGAKFELRIGGKVGRTSGDPLDLEIEVISVHERHTQSGLTAPVPLGLSACVRCGNVDIVLSSIRRQTFAPDAFTGLGLNLDDYKIIVVKSTQHFQAAFAVLGRKIIYVSGPGALDMQFAALPYSKRSLDYWPRVDDPLHLD